MSCWALTRSRSSAFGANESISSRRTLTIRAAFSPSGAAGSSFFTGRAFTASARPLAPARPLLAGAFAASHARDQLVEAAVELGQPRLLDQRRQVQVGLRLLVAEPVDQRGHPLAVRRVHLLVESAQSGDRDVAVAALAEAVGEPFTSRSAWPWGLPGKQGSNTSSAARSRRVATRMSCTRSMSPVSRTPARVLGQLGRADRDDPGRGLAVAVVGAQAGDRLRLRHAAEPTCGRRAAGRAMRPGPSRRTVSAAVEQVEDDALAQAALADLQRLAEQLARASPAAGRRPGSSLTRRGSSSKRLATSAISSLESTRTARSRVSYSSTAPTSVRSEVALPPTATAWSGCSSSTSSKKSAIASRSARISDGRGRIALQVLLGQRARADLEGADLGDPLGDRAEDHLGGAAADVDDGDVALDRVARATWSRRGRRAGPPPPR